MVTALALAVAVLATFAPAIRAARASTVAALADAARTPRRRAWLIALSRRLPVPLMIGLRLAARRPRRLVLATASTTITVALLVAVVAVHDRAHGHSNVPGGLINPIHAGVDQVLDVITVVLVLLAIVNAIFVAWTTAIDARHPLAVSRSLGATSEQVVAGLSMAQLLPAVPGALLGIPAGIGLLAVGHGGAVPVPSPLALMAVFVVAVVVVTAITAVPARIGARCAVAEILQAELA